jgi:purine-binding chemotaxis protein CheW
MIRVPHGPPKLAGLANLRGTATPIYVLADLLSRSDGGEAHWVIVLNQKPSWGVLVDRVEAVSDGHAVESGVMSVSEAGQNRQVALNDLLAEQTPAFRPRAAVAEAVVAQTLVEDRQGAEVGLLAFTVAGQNYALPLSEIAEVASLPDGITVGRVLSRSKAMVRGARIDLISPGRLLGLEDLRITGNERVIVMTVAGKRAGLVVGGARAVVRAPQSSICTPPSRFNRDGDKARIHAVLRMPDGPGFMSLLTVASLFHGEQTQTTERSAAAPEEIRSRDKLNRFIIFRIDREDYAVAIDKVGEIVRLPGAITRVPGAPDFVAGAINLRGKVVPILDQRTRFGAVAAAADRDDRILVVDIGGRRAGLLVDAVSDIIEVGESQITEAPELSAVQQRLFDHVITLEQGGHMILVVDPAALLSPAEHDQLARTALADESARQ